MPLLEIQREARNRVRNLCISIIRLETPTSPRRLLCSVLSCQSGLACAAPKVREYYNIKPPRMDVAASKQTVFKRSFLSPHVRDVHANPIGIAAVVYHRINLCNATFDAVVNRVGEDPRQHHMKAVTFGMNPRIKPQGRHFTIKRIGEILAQPRFLPVVEPIAI